MKQYVEFNQETGNIISIGPSQEGNCIEIEDNLATSLKTGEKKIDDFKVLLNKENKKYTLREIRKDEELSKKFIEEQPASNVIHQLSETYKLADGVNIIQDIAKGEWSVKITGQTKTLIEGLTKTNKELKQLFYVTDKNNPNILHDTLVVDLNKVIEDDGTKLINFDKQSAKLNISVFCRNLYNEYNHVIENG
jgi:hypothetical protein